MLKELHTPCFILDKQELVKSISEFKHALLNNFGNYIVGYSVKTNSLPYCLNVANAQGCYAEVVSSDEYDLALLCGFNKKNIIYNGPMKSKESFLEAVINGAIVNIETHRELDWLDDLPKDNRYKIGLRLNVNISKVAPEDADGENDNSRFGFSDETNEFEDAINRITRMPNIVLAGLHSHRTAHSRSINFYESSIRNACETINKYNLSLDYLDIGGGYFGIFANKPTYQQYSDAFKKILSSYGQEKLCIIVEPGNALVASCFSFLSEIIDVKHVEDKCYFLTTDGSRNDIDPFFRKTGYMTDIISDKNGPVVEEQIVSGCTCLEYDRLFSLRQSPLLETGDRILYKNVGAYTMCLSPLFIRYLPIIYVNEDGKYNIIREKWTAKEYINKSILQ